MIKLIPLILLPLSLCLFSCCSFSFANEANNLHKLLKSRRSQNRLLSDSWSPFEATNTYSPVYIGPQDGLMEVDKINLLPGQPADVDFDQYSGYVTVDPHAGRALFYYFVESPLNSSIKPLVLWLNGVANVIFLESPAGVGFSYSNTSSDYQHTGDKSTANDAYTFLVNWLERFPQYKNREFYITGESYAGHYVPQLAYTILLNNKITNQTKIDLKGIAIGNAWIDDITGDKGFYDYFWTHALNSDETHEGITTSCGIGNENISDKCESFSEKAFTEIGGIDLYNIYAPRCHNPVLRSGSTGSVNYFDPCSDTYLDSYLNIPEVQKALHAKLTTWSVCRFYNWTDRPDTILPIIQKLVANDIRVWIYSGDTDAVVPVTSSRYAITSLKLPIITAWHPWYTNNEVGGYVEAYKGVTFVTVRGAGHLVPSYQPERALIMFSSFLQDTLPPSS